MKHFLCELLFGCLLAGPSARSIDELTYGTALFAYYQEDYQQALVNVLVAERQQRLGDDPLRFQLAKGSFAFQERMYRLADATFDAVASSELNELDRMRLDFHLAREHYRTGDLGAMEAALARIDLGADRSGRPRQHPEVSFMRAEAALARGDPAAAETVLATLPEGERYRAYGLYNLGVAYRDAGRTGAAYDAFRRLSQMPAADQETWDLVQRGRVALAVMARHEAGEARHEAGEARHEAGGARHEAGEAVGTAPGRTGDAVDARAMLGALPGAGRYRDLALSSYGSLAMAQGDYRLAARIWLTLVQQDEWSAGQAMARLGLPMSLEQLASPAHALDRYRDAERAFQTRLTALETVSARARDPAWIDRLLDAFAEPDEARRTRALTGLDAGLGRRSWLAWLAGEDVHRVLVEWRELNGMASWLDTLPGRIAAYREITAERRRRSAAAGTLLGAEALPERRAELAERVARLDADLNALRRQPARMEADSMRRLATGQERALIDELTVMSAQAAARLPPAERPRVEARIRRLLGTTFWTIADDRAVRIRALETQLDDNRALLADVDDRIERLARAESRFAAGVETDFLALSERADDVAGRVAAALDGRRRVVAAALERGLRDEMAQTRRYLLAAQIAIARATDQLAAGDAASGSDS